MKWLELKIDAAPAGLEPVSALLEDLGITGLGSQKFTRDAEGNIQDNTGVNDASELYTISGDITLKVDDILDDIIFVICPNENPDGRTYNTRRNDNGFDLNRDASNQTQNETTNLVQVINDWNPVVFAELHGYMTEFLVEPCTPPHEPNLEYDLLVKNFALGSEAFGTAALGTMSATREEHPDTLYWSYYMPLRDDYDPSTMHWSAWDDLCTNYGPSYAMLNCGSLGYTIETPYNNEASTDLFEYGVYGLIDYVMEHKDDIYHNQLEFFRRGIENEDHRDSMEKWYVDVNNKQLQSDTWRVPYEENDNYFPEYYVIPVDAASQRDPADAYAMGRFLLRNGVRVSSLDTDTAVGGVTYRAGSLVVDMQIPAHRHGGRRGHPLQQRQRGGPRGQRPAGCRPHRKPHHLRRPQGRLCSLPCQLRDGCGRLCALRHPDGRVPRGQRHPEAHALPRRPL